MSPVIAAMVVLCSVCAVLMVVTIIGSIYFWLDYKEFKSNAKWLLRNVEQTKYQVDEKWFSK